MGKVFITGVSPVAMRDLTNACNVAENIYLLPQFNTLRGFLEAEIAADLSKIATEYDLPQSSADEALSMMRTFYNGYRFSRNVEEQVYNPTLALYFLKVFQRDYRYPDRILDNNLAMDRCKMHLHYISRLPEGRQLIFDALVGTEPVTIFELADRFGVEDILYARKDTDFVASFIVLFRHPDSGRRDAFSFGELTLRAPNLVIRKLYAAQIQEMLLPEGREGDLARRAAETLYQRNDLQPLCDFIEQKYFKLFSNY